MGYAAALTGSAIVAGRPPIEGFCQVGGSTGRHHPAEFCLHALAEAKLSAGHRHGRLEDSVRDDWIPFRLAGDADVLLDDVVIRRQVSVAERPVNSVTVVRRPLEVQIAVAKAQPPPDVRAATADSQPAAPDKRF